MTQMAQGERLRGGRYELQNRLGRGGAATVWLARDTVLERPVAVKVLAPATLEDEAWVARFRREARVAANLSHPNLVSVYDFDADADPPFLVMAYLGGGSLEERIEAGEEVEPEPLARDLLAALAAIHAAGVVHRDVKPSNVLFDDSGRACLADFGIAKPEDATSITQTNQIPGTAAYMAPELWRGEPASPASDLYSAGVVLAKAGAAESGLAPLVARLRADDPAVRPADAAEALALIEPARSEGGASSPIADAKTRVARTPTAPRSRPRWLPVAAIGIVAVAVAAVVALGGGSDEPTPSAQNSEANGAPEKERPRERREREPAGGSGGSDGEAQSQGAAAEGAPAADPVALNDQGFALIQEGNYEQAIPPLEQAVAAYPDGSTDLQYGYALFNLANALRLAGRPDEAIPLLEERLRIPDQTATVREELRLARQAANE